MKVFYIQPLHADGMDRLRAKYDVQIASAPDRATLLRESGDAQVIVTRLTPVDAEWMARVRGLKAVAKHGVGVDNIDTDYCLAQGIGVLTTGDANSSTVAEHALLALGALMKRIPSLDCAMRRGNWAARDTAGAWDLMGRTLGIIGFGRIGRHLARMAVQGFGMRVCVYDPFALRAEVENAGYAFFSDLDAMLPMLDAVSPHVPLTKETHHLLDLRRLALLKRGAIVLNFARGGVVEEAALDAALESGHIAAAALDVFEEEPPDWTKPLYHRENVLLSPHCATFTEDSRRRMSLRLAEEIERVLG